MRTYKIINSSLEVQSLFDIFTSAILGKTIDVHFSDEESIAHMLKEHAKGKKFELELMKSTCGKYTDILSIKPLI